MAAATLYGAVKAYLEAQGWGITVYRDRAPNKAPLPYVVFMGDVSLALSPLEDGGATTGSEEIQLDLYETWRDAADKSGESPSLADAITAKLQGSSTSYGSSPKKQVYGLLQRNRSRLAPPDERITRHTYIVDAIRQIA